MSVRAAAIRLLVFTVAGALATTSCGGSGATIAPSSQVVEASDYPMYKGGLGRTGEADGSGPSGPAVVAWSVETKGRIESGPAVVDGVLYIVAGDRTVRALDSATGEAALDLAGDRTTPDLQPSQEVRSTSSAGTSRSRPCRRPTDTRSGASRAPSTRTPARSRSMTWWSAAARRG